MTKLKTGGHPDLKMVNPNAAAINIGSTMHMAAVTPDTDIMPVRAFGTFTQDLHDLAAGCRACGVTSVAMETTGVYWIPAFEILEARGFEVILVNARYAKNVPGRALRSVGHRSDSNPRSRPIAGSEAGGRMRHGPARPAYIGARA